MTGTANQSGIDDYSIYVTAGRSIYSSFLVSQPGWAIAQHSHQLSLDLVQETYFELQIRSPIRQKMNPFQLSNNLLDNCPRLLMRLVFKSAFNTVESSLQLHLQLFSGGQTALETRRQLFSQLISGHPNRILDSL